MKHDPRERRWRFIVDGHMKYFVFDVDPFICKYCSHTRDCSVRFTQEYDSEEMRSSLARYYDLYLNEITTNFLVAIECEILRCRLATIMYNHDLITQDQWTLAFNKGYTLVSPLDTDTGLPAWIRNTQLEDFLSTQKRYQSRSEESKATVAHAYNLPKLNYQKRGSVY